jgi:hypothetical protein
MARLPGVIDVSGPRGARPSGRIAQSSFEGLSDVADGLADLGAALGRKDEADADKILEASRGAFDQRLGTLSAEYDGQEPGFANRALASFDNHFTAVTEDTTYSKGVQAALRDKLAGLRADVGRRAIGVETQGRGEVIAAQRRDREAAALSDQVIPFNARFQTRFKALTDGFDGSDPAYATNVLQAYDEESQATLQAAPEALRPALERTLQGRRVSIHARVLEAQDKAHDAFVTGAAQRSVGALANTVLSNPAAYDDAVADLDGALAGLPPALRTATRREAQGDLATSRIEALIRDGDHELARGELDDGRYDGVLTPERKATLLARAEAAETGGARSVEDFRAAYEADAAIESEVEARARGESTGLSLTQMAAMLSPREMAAAERKLAAADRVFAATGKVRDLTGEALRARLAEPEPDPAAGGADYAERLSAWELGRKAAAAELERRNKDPAAWVLTSERAGDAGAQARDKLEAYLETPPEDWAEHGRRGGAFAGQMWVEQARAGIAPQSRRILPKDQAAALVERYAEAEAGPARAAALESLAVTLRGMPQGVKMTFDGSTLNARTMVARELGQAGLAPADVSALVDLGDDKARLRTYADATANPTARAALPGKGAESGLRAAVEARLSRYFETADALPGSSAQNEGRLARARIVARHLMTARGLTAREAADAATADLVDDYRFVDGWRMPKAEADGVTAGRQNHSLARDGLSKATFALIRAEAGALAAPTGVRAGVAAADAQRIAADRIEQAGRWVTLENDGGVGLMLPTTSGWTPATDKWGRPIRMSWSQAYARGRGEAAGSWVTPPPAAATPQRAAPAKARAAVAAALEWQESRGRTDAVSPKGALGVRQLLPGTARDAARMAGLAAFNGKSDDQVREILVKDPALNRRLSDRHIAFLSDRYDGHVGLMLAAYNAGHGRVDTWLRRFGDPRRGRVSLDDWVADIPFEETRKYVRAVLPRAVAELSRK